MNLIVALTHRCALVVVLLMTLASTPGTGAERPDLFEIWVGHELVECPSDPARLCYLIKREQYEEWSVFEGSLGSFRYREGVAYILLVEEDLTASDGEQARTRFRVVQVLEEFESFDQPETPSPMASSAEEPVEPIEVARAPEPVMPTPAPPPADGSDMAPQPPAPRPEPSSAPGETYRGHLVIGSGTEARSFTFCGDEVGIWIEDESGAYLWKVYRERVEAPNRPLLIEVRGQIGAPPASGFGSHYDRQLTVLEVLRVDAESTGCAEVPAPLVAAKPAAIVEQTAEPVAVTPGGDLDIQRGVAPLEIQLSTQGTPPFSNLRIGTDGIVLSAAAPSETLRFPFAAPERSSNRTTYITSVQGQQPHDLKVVIDRETCPDPATGARRDFTAYVTLDGRWLRGCVSSGNPGSTP